MATHVSDASYAPEPPQDEIANQVLAKLQDESLTSAFNYLKSSVQNVYSGKDENQDGKIDVRDHSHDVPMNDKEKEAFWTSLAKDLEQKKPGVLANLSAIWMKDFQTNELKNTPFEANFVEQIARAGKLMNKTFAEAALKDLPNIKDLAHEDGIIDLNELDRNIARQKQTPREQFVKDLLSTAGKEAETNPAKAVETIYKALKDRRGTETQAELSASFKAVADALREQPELAAKLSSGYMIRNFKDVDTEYAQHKEDFRITKEELNDFTPDSVGKVFIDYVKANFDAMSTTSVHDKSYRGSTSLTADEFVNHINRLKRDSQKKGN